MPTVPRKAAKKKKATVRRVSRPRPSARVAKSRKKKPAVPQPTPAAVVSLPKVRVRMYRQGLGDCFLLTFNPGGDKTTNGHLHLVVATHQHQDHLSGFPKIADQFSPGKNKQIDHVWLAWTEDPNDQLAKQLGKARDDMAIAVKSAAQAMREIGRAHV